MFVAISTALALGFGAWAIRDYRLNGQAAALIAAVSSFVGAVVLLLYGRWFLRKLKDTSYL